MPLIGTSKQVIEHKLSPFIEVLQAHQLKLILQDLVNNQDFQSLTESDQIHMLVYTVRLFDKKSSKTNRINISII